MRGPRPPKRVHDGERKANPIGLLQQNSSQYQNQFMGVGSMDWNISGSDQMRARYVQNELRASNTEPLLPRFSPHCTTAL